MVPKTPVATPMKKRMTSSNSDPKMIHRFLMACDGVDPVFFLLFMVLLFFDVKPDVGDAFQHGFAHGLFDFEMIGSRQGEKEVLVERHRQVAHATTTLANPFTFGRGQGAFDGVVGVVTVGHGCVEEHKEIAITIVLQMTQPDAELVGANGVVDVDIECHMVFLLPLGFRDDNTLVE